MSGSFLGDLACTIVQLCRPTRRVLIVVEGQEEPPRKRKEPEMDKADVASMIAVELLRAFGWDAKAVTTRRGNAILVSHVDGSRAYYNTLAEVKAFLARNNGARV